MHLLGRHRATEVPATVLLPSDPHNPLPVELDPRCWPAFAEHGSGPVTFGLVRSSMRPSDLGALGVTWGDELVGHLARHDAERYWGAIALAGRLGRVMAPGRLNLSPSGWWGWIEVASPDEIRAHLSG